MAVTNSKWLPWTAQLMFGKKSWGYTRRIWSMVKDCISFSDQKWLNWDPRVHRDVALTEDGIFFSVRFRYWWKISLACFFPLKGMLSVMAVVRGRRSFYATSSAFSVPSPASAAPGRRNIHDLRHPLTVKISIAQKPVCVPRSLSRGIRFSCKKILWPFC